MFDKVSIGKRVRVFFSSQSPGVEGNVQGIERDAEDAIISIQLQSPAAPAVGTLDLDSEVMTKPGFRVVVLGDLLN